MKTITEGLAIIAMLAIAAVLVAGILGVDLV